MGRRFRRISPPGSDRLGPVIFVPDLRVLTYHLDEGFHFIWHKVGFHHRVLWMNEGLDDVVVVLVCGWDYPEDEGDPPVFLVEIIAEDG